MTRRYTRIARFLLRQPLARRNRLSFDWSEAVLFGRDVLRGEALRRGRAWEVVSV